MKKKRNLKLSLNKRTISELNKSTQNAVHGGYGSYGDCILTINPVCNGSGSACHICHTDVGCTTGALC